MKVKALQVGMIATALLALTAMSPAARAEEYTQRNDRPDLRQDTREIRQDVREIRQDRQELRGDYQQLAKDRADFQREKAEGDVAGMRRERMEMRNDKKEIGRDQAELRRDQAELRHDVRERRQDGGGNLGEHRADQRPGQGQQANRGSWGEQRPHRGEARAERNEHRPEAQQARNEYRQDHRNPQANPAQHVSWQETAQPQVGHTTANVPAGSPRQNNGNPSGGQQGRGNAGRRS